jgi:hypothetical protein
LNVLLARRVGEKKHEIAILKEEARLKAGDSLPPFDGKTLDGSPVAVNYKRATVLYVLTPECRWCIKNAANINAVARAVESDFDIVGISLAPASRVLSAHVLASKYQFPILTELPAAALLALKIGGTPQTVVVSSEGKVVRSWFGAFAGRTADDVEAFFRIRLPGLLDDAKTQGFDRAVQ